MKLKLLLALLIINGTSFAQNVTFDATFGSDGKVITPVFQTSTQSSGSGIAIAVQVDGKILVCGNMPFAGIGNHFIARYTSAGDIDTTFGTNGFVFPPIVSEASYPSCFKLLNDGKMLIAGTKGAPLVYDFAVAKYNSDGSPDTTFGTNGVAVNTLAGGDFAYGMEVQSDNKIVVCGYTQISSERDFGVTRFNENGSIDTAFGTNGKVLVNFGTSIDLTPLRDIAISIKIQSDNKIIIDGTTTDYSNDGEVSDFSLVRINTNGTVDSSYGNNGLVITDFGGADVLYAMTITSDDKIIAAGYSTSYTDENSIAVLSKYNTDGTLDTAFSTDGKVSTQTSTTANIDAISDIKILPNNTILCAGVTFTNSGSDFLLMRYTADGLLDAGFDGDGILITDLGSMSDIGLAIAVQPDSKILFTGSKMINELGNIALLRYNIQNLASDEFKFSTFSAWPNPFRDVIHVGISLDAPHTVSIDLIDINGRTIRNLAKNKPFSAGITTEAMVLPAGLSNGIYLLKVTAGNRSEIIRIVK